MFALPPASHTVVIICKLAEDCTEDHNVVVDTYPSVPNTDLIGFKAPITTNTDVKVPASSGEVMFRHPDPVLFSFSGAENKKKTSVRECLVKPCMA